MKTHILFIVLLVSISSNIQAQILKENEDVREKDFSFEALNDLDSRMGRTACRKTSKTLMSRCSEQSFGSRSLRGEHGSPTGNVRNKHENGRANNAKQELQLQAYGRIGKYTQVN